MDEVEMAMWKQRYKMRNKKSEKKEKGRRAVIQEAFDIEKLTELKHTQGAS
jgi:hypothetical protein